MAQEPSLCIIPWSHTHAEWLRYAIGEFFEAGLARGGDLCNTPRNVDAYLSLGLAGAERGDPCLLAIVREVPVAFVMWIGVPPVLDARRKTISATGSYTEPAWRNCTIATALREAAISMAKEKGYECIQGPVQLNNPRGVYEFCHTYGAWPVSVNFELEI